MQKATNNKKPHLGMKASNKRPSKYDGPSPSNPGANQKTKTGTMKARPAPMSDPKKDGV